MQSSSCEETIVVPVPVDDEGNTVNVLLGARLQARSGGGLQWTQLPDSTATLQNVVATSQMTSMLHDTVRNDKYERAIRYAVHRFRTDNGRPPVVLDIGAGTGLLSLFAARAGAAAVFACEMFPHMAEIAHAVTSAATESTAVNDFGEPLCPITVLAGRSTHVVVADEIDDEDTSSEANLVLPQRADILVTEIFDSVLLGEAVIPTLRHAVAHLLVPGAEIVPHAARVIVAGVEFPRLQQLRDTSRAGFAWSLLDQSDGGGRPGGAAAADDGAAAASATPRPADWVPLSRVEDTENCPAGAVALPMHVGAETPSLRRVTADHVVLEFEFRGSRSSASFRAVSAEERRESRGCCGFGDDEDDEDALHLWSTTYVLPALRHARVDGMALWWELVLHDPADSTQTPIIYCTRPTHRELAEPCPPGSSLPTPGMGSSARSAAASAAAPSSASAARPGAPTLARAESVWQDHWLPIFIPAQVAGFEVNAGDELLVTVAHDDYRIWTHVRTMEASAHLAGPGGADGGARAPEAGATEAMPKGTGDDPSPLPCECGVHLLCNADRIRHLGDAQQKRLWLRAVDNALQTLASERPELTDLPAPTAAGAAAGGAGVDTPAAPMTGAAALAQRIVQLNVSDSPLLALAATTHPLLGAKVSAVTLDPLPFSGLLSAKLAHQAGVTHRLSVFSSGLDAVLANPEEFAEAWPTGQSESDADEKGEEDDEANDGEEGEGAAGKRAGGGGGAGDAVAPTTLPPIDVLTSELFHFQMQGRPTWLALNFLYQRLAVDSLLTRRRNAEPLVLPVGAVVVAGVVELGELWRSHGHVGTVSGFDHSPLDAVQASWQSHTFHYPLGMYAHRWLVQPQAVAVLDFQDTWKCVGRIDAAAAALKRKAPRSPKRTASDSAQAEGDEGAGVGLEDVLTAVAAAGGGGGGGSGGGGGGGAGDEERAALVDGEDGAGEEGDEGLDAAAELEVEPELIILRDNLKVDVCLPLEAAGTPHAVVVWIDIDPEGDRARQLADEIRDHNAREASGGAAKRTRGEGADGAGATPARDSRLPAWASPSPHTITTGPFRADGEPSGWKQALYMDLPWTAHAAGSTAVHLTLAPDVVEGNGFLVTTETCDP